MLIKNNIVETDGKNKKKAETVLTGMLREDASIINTFLLKLLPEDHLASSTLILQKQNPLQHLEIRR